MSCLCNGGAKNTGVSTCLVDLKNPTMAYKMAMRADDGTENKIPANLEDLDDAAWLALLRNPDPSKRLYPIAISTKNKNRVFTPSDNTTESYDDNSTAVVEEGGQDVTWELIGVTPKYLRQLKDFKCQDFGLFFADKPKNLRGYCKDSDDNNLYPVHIDSETWSARWQEAGGATKAKVLISFSYANEVLEENLDFIVGERISADILNTPGLLDVIPSIEVVSSTVTRVTANLIFGGKGSLSTGKGLTDLTDWSFEDKDGNTLLISQVQDLEIEGIYDITHDDSTGLTPITVKGGNTSYDKGYEIESKTSV